MLQPSDIAIVNGARTPMGRYCGKLRKLLADIKMPGKEEPLPFNGGIAEAVVRQPFDAVDIVTEVINRAEHALDKATAESPNGAHTEPPGIETVAVA